MAKTIPPVVNPNLGIYYDRSPLALDGRMLQDGMNIRIKLGRLSNLNLGWIPFQGFDPTGSNLILKSINTPGTGGQVAQPVVLINTFSTRTIGDFLIIGTTTDLYKYTGGADATHGTVVYITPTYSTGTASASGTAVTGVGTLWNTAPSNIKVGDEISFGSATQNLQSATWFYISAVLSDTTLTLATTAGTVGSGPYTIRRKFTGAITNLWQTEQFLNASNIEDRWYATNGIDPGVRWNGTDFSATMLNTGSFLQGGSPLLFGSIKQYQNMMIYANLVQAGTKRTTDIVNSDVGNPETLSGGVAGQYKVHSRPDGIVRMEKLADYLVIYSLKGVTVSFFAGAPVLFTFRQTIEGKGPLGGRAVARFPNYHEFLGVDSQYAFDGATTKEINKHFWRSTLTQQDPVRTVLTNAHFIEQDGDLLWSLPQTTDPGSGTASSPPSVAAAEHYLEDIGQALSPSAAVTLVRPVTKRSFIFLTTGYTTRNQALTWDQLVNQWSSYNFRWTDQFFFAAFPLSLGGYTDGKVYNFAVAQDANTGGVQTGLVSFARFGRRPTLDGRMRGLLKRIYAFVSSYANPLNITARMSDDAVTPPAIIQTNPLDQTFANKDYYFTTPYRRGRYYEVEFGTAGPGQPWELSGYDTEVAHALGKGGRHLPVGGRR